MATSGAGLLPNNLLNLNMGNKEFTDDTLLRVAGDIRANVHPPMLALHVIFVVS